MWTWFIESAPGLVVRDEVDFCAGVGGQTREFPRHLRRIVHAGEQDVLDGEQTAGHFAVPLARRQDFADVAAEFGGDEQSAGLLGDFPVHR